MKYIKNNKKGFTLVELLAVIVVLAIIMLIAVNNVIPMINDSKLGAFASTGNIVIDAAQNKYLTDQLGIATASGSACYKVETLISSGFVKKITAEDYAGSFVTIKVDDNNKETYHIYLHSASQGYYISADDSVTKSDVKTETNATKEDVPNSCQ